MSQVLARVFRKAKIEAAQALRGVRGTKILAFLNTRRQNHGQEAF